MGISDKWAPKESNSKQACIGLMTYGEAGVANLDVKRSEFGGECEGTQPVQREQTRGTS